MEALEADLLEVAKAKLREIAGELTAVTKASAVKDCGRMIHRGVSNHLAS